MVLSETALHPIQQLVVLRFIYRCEAVVREYKINAPAVFQKQSSSSIMLRLIRLCVSLTAAAVLKSV